MQQQLASREKELLALEGPLVPGYQQFGDLSSTHSERLPAPICELWERSKEDKGVGQQASKDHTCKARPVEHEMYWT